MFLHFPPFLIYEIFPFDSYPKKAPFWLPKSRKLDPPTSKNRCCFFHGFFCRFFFDFGSILGGFWEAFGGLWGSKWRDAVKFPAFAMWYLKKMPPDGTDDPPQGPFGDHLGTTWGPFGDHFGIILATFWIPTPLLGPNTPSTSSQS